MVRWSGPGYGLLCSGSVRNGGDRCSWVRFGLVSYGPVSGAFGMEWTGAKLQGGMRLAPVWYGNFLFL